MGNRKATDGTCPVCNRMKERDLAELDLLLSMPPEELDAALFGDLEVPPEELPAEWRRFGVIRKAQHWLGERGYDFSRQSLVAHYNNHLTATAIPSDGSRALQEGTLSDGTPAPSRPAPLMAAIQYHNFFTMGMNAGMRALEILGERLANNDTERVPNDVLIRIANIGKGLAQAQAAIVTRGQNFTGREDDTLDGFMGDQPSPRFGHSRVRELPDGTTRPVADQGPADRMGYNERARQEGGDLLPAPGPTTTEPL